MEKEIMTKVYILYSITNYAETWRDQDRYSISGFKAFTTFEKMSAFVIPFINDQINKDWEEKVNKIEFDKEGKWYYPLLGSFSPTYVVEEVEADEAYLTQKAEREKEEAAYNKWIKELGLIQEKTNRL